MSSTQHPQFSIEGYNTLIFQVQSHLVSLHNLMWEVIENGPIVIVKVIAGNRLIEQRDLDGNVQAHFEGIPDHVIPKPRAEFTTYNFKVDNLDRLTHNVI